MFPTKNECFLLPFLHKIVKNSRNWGIFMFKIAQKMRKYLEECANLSKIRELFKTKRILWLSSAFHGWMDGGERRLVDGKIMELFHIKIKRGNARGRMVIES
jgi:hypothetical protein